MTETFDVHITFKDKTTFKEPGHDIDGVKSAILRLTRGPGSIFVSEVLVTDQMDLAVFHAKDGTIVFPTPTDGGT